MRKALRIVAMAFGALAIVILGCAVYFTVSPLPRYADVPLPDIHAVDDPAVIARGRYVAHAISHCPHCHAPAAEITRHQTSRGAPDDLSGGSPISGGPFGDFYPANLTPDETGIAGLSDGQLARAVRQGILHDGSLSVVMSAAVGQLSDEDLRAVISYLRALPPIKHAVSAREDGVLSKAMLRLFRPRKHAQVQHVPEGPPSVARGKYIAENAGLCSGCHTAHEQVGTFEPMAPPFSGGSPFPDRSDPAFEFAPPNLTPDESTGHLRGWSEDAFVSRFRAGRAFADSPMPWESFAQMTDDDLRSIYRYLQTLPPVRNITGPVRRKAG